MRSAKEGSGGISRFVAALEKYAVFGGRSRRKEYWFFALFSLIVTMVLSIRRLHDIDRLGWWFLISFLPWSGP